MSNKEFVQIDLEHYNELRDFRERIESGGAVLEERCYPYQSKLLTENEALKDLALRINTGKACMEELKQTWEEERQELKSKIDEGLEMSIWMFIALKWKLTERY